MLNESVVGRIAVGSLAFVEKVKGELGIKALHREFEQIGEAYALRDPYARNFSRENEARRSENTLWMEAPRMSGHRLVRPSTTTLRYG